MQRVPEPEYMDIDEEAAAYANADFNEVNAAFVNSLLEFVGPGNDSYMLDLGSGPGDIPRRISEARPDWRIVGIDASMPMLRRAAARRAPPKTRAHLWYVLCDAKRLPFPSQSCDIVVSNSILHHLEDTVTFWKEVERVMRPGGRLFLRDLSRPADKAEAARVVDKYSGNETALLKEEFYRSLLAAYTPDEVRSQLNDADLTGMRVARVTDRHLDVWGTLSR
ncbi:MAG TPA: class I SAM-dependent methyltransferase [Candidatus Hydrogenedentes bacterium]|nr:class I SAM-dependent methyltransferase [Candidatus Hydrogenedentota bacterium]